MNRRSFVRYLPALALLPATGLAVANGAEAKDELRRMFLRADRFNRAMRMQADMLNPQSRRVRAYQQINNTLTGVF